MPVSYSSALSKRGHSVEVLAKPFTIHFIIIYRHQNRQDHIVNVITVSFQKHPFSNN